MFNRFWNWFFVLSFTTLLTASLDPSKPQGFDAREEFKDLKEGDEIEIEIYTGWIKDLPAVSPPPAPSKSKLTTENIEDLIKDKNSHTAENPFTKAQILANVNDPFAKAVLSKRRVRKTAGQHGRTLSIIGTDDRVDVDENAFPNSVVGLFYNIHGHCTGEIVGDYFVMLTNRHCFNDDPNFWEQSRFLPGYQTYADGSYSARGLGYLTHVIYNDYWDFAVFRVERLTTAWPWAYLGWWYWDSDTYFDSNRAVKQIAYSGDHAGVYSNPNFDVNSGKYPSQAKISTSCTTMGRSGDFVKHNCDTTGGASGSALLDSEDHVLAVHHSGATTYNLATSTLHFRTALEEQIAKPDPVLTPYPTAPTISNCAPGCPPNWPGDNFCDAACNNAACNYDNGDCNCAPGCPQNWPGDNFCDAACNNAACNFDDGDCECASGCPSNWLGDNYCDAACNNAACNFDNGDCPTKSPTTKFPTTMFPTKTPTIFPTRSPTRPTSQFPTKLPTVFPSKSPSRPTSQFPTKPTTQRPTKFPTTAFPTKKPSMLPSRAPTRPTTLFPTKKPSKQPTKMPTKFPTKRPGA